MGRTAGKCLPRVEADGPALDSLVRFSSRRNEQDGCLDGFVSRHDAARLFFGGFLPGWHCCSSSPWREAGARPSGRKSEGNKSRTNLKQILLPIPYWLFVFDSPNRCHRMSHLRCLASMLRLQRRTLERTPIEEKRKRRKGERRERRKDKTCPGRVRQEWAGRRGSARHVCWSDGPALDSLVRFSSRRNEQISGWLRSSP